MPKGKRTPTVDHAKRPAFRALQPMKIGDRMYRPGEMLPVDQTSAWAPSAIRACLNTEQMEIIPEPDRPQAVDMQAEYDREFREKAPLRAKKAAVEAKHRAAEAQKVQAANTTPKVDDQGRIDITDSPF